MRCGAHDKPETVEDCQPNGFSKVFRYGWRQQRTWEWPSKDPFSCCHLLSSWRTPQTRGFLLSWCSEPEQIQGTSMLLKEDLTFASLGCYHVLRCSFWEGLWFPVTRGLFSTWACAEEPQSSGAVVMLLKKSRGSVARQSQLRAPGVLRTEPSLLLLLFQALHRGSYKFFLFSSVLESRAL